jgi:hypothetical protein
MMNVTKESVEKLLAMFGDQESIELEHEQLMDMLGGMPEEADEEYGDDEDPAEGESEEVPEDGMGYMQKMGMMGAHGKKPHGPKLMALKSMGGKGE